MHGGRCEACDGNGSNRLEMDFLADVWVTCPVCQGHRFNRETLQVMFKEKSIAEVLEMDVQQALEHFENIPQIHHKLSTLHAVGLDYIKLGQPSPTLSGGEAQRIKLARELVKKSTGRTLYLLDEPTTGLHFADIELLLKVLHDFVDAGNTVLVVEHNLDVIKTADWIIDIGPEGGDGGGRIVACGTPEEVAKHPGVVHGPGTRAAAWGSMPRRRKRRRPRKQAATARRPARRRTSPSAAPGSTICATSSLKIPRDEMTVFCGPSGSGKTSLAMDTIYAEGQRRYVESLSSYARQFVGQMQKPQVDHIDGLSPAIAIEQRNTGHTPRSTVGTVTEIYDYFRILFARLGQPHCPECDIPIGTQTSDEIVDKLLEEPEGTKLYVMAPVEVQVGEQYETLWESLRGAGYVRVRDRRRDAFARQDARRSTAAASTRSKWSIDRIVVRPRCSARGSPAASRTRWRWAKAWCTSPIRTTTCPSRAGRCASTASTWRAKSAAAASRRSTRTIFRSTARSAGARRAKGSARRPARIRPRCSATRSLTLAKGALLVWPDVSLADLRSRCSPRSRRTPACRSTCRTTISRRGRSGRAVRHRGRVD